MIIDVSPDLAKRIANLADEQGSTIEEILEEFLRERLDEREPKKRRLTLADLAEIALSAGLSSDKPVDTAARSREILQTEYAEYLQRRRSRDAHS